MLQPAEKEKSGAGKKGRASPPSAKFAIDTVRHSTAHLMAAAIYSLFQKKVKFGVGPPLDNGFYYDIKLPEGMTITGDLLTKIEAEMNRLRKLALPYERIELDIDAAIQFMKDHGQTYKSELLDLLKTKGSTAVQKETGDDGIVSSEEGAKKVSFYKTGDFVDLCRGPHVDNSSQTGEVKLTNITAAYWRGKAENDSMQRLYGLCFHTQEELAAEIQRLEEIKKNDHRTIGAERKLFTFAPNDIGVGLSLWLPNGAAMRAELDLLSTEFQRDDHYLPVNTSILAKESIYERSGHLAHYKDDMYNSIEIEGDKYRLRPMNCPHHHMIFKHEARSYRDLPLRFTEQGNVFRYEASGALTGLLRTRGFTQNDAHIYCTYEQTKEIFKEVMNLHARYYKLLGLEKYYMRLSLPGNENDKKFVKAPEKWDAALRIIREAMEELKLPVKEVAGEAAFYGPKIDVQVTNSLGNEYTISTNQIDFLASERFDLTYQGADGKQHPVYVIHRTPLGSHERFIAFLCEHYKGSFPTWLSPVQCKILPVSLKAQAYAKQVEEFLFKSKVKTATGGLRVEMDSSDTTLPKKVLFAQQDKIPYIIVVGEKEMENGNISVRTRDNKTKVYQVDEFLEMIKHEVENRIDNSREEVNFRNQQRPVNFRDFLIAKAGASAVSRAETSEVKEELKPKSP